VSHYTFTPKEVVSVAAKLTPKQRRFVNEYLIDLNATQAAIRAGYSKKTAQQIGAENLSKPVIQAEIQKRQVKLQNKLEITQERVLQELAAIAFANGADFAKVVNTGLLPTVEMIPTDELAPEKLPAIAGIKANQYGVEVKLHDKVKALELLGKYLGTFEGGATQEQSENNLFEAIDSIGEEDLNDLPEVQHSAEGDSDMVED
jgi:phage terminase small subunit